MNHLQQNSVNYALWTKISKQDSNKEQNIQDDLQSKNSHSNKAHMTAA